MKKNYVGRAVALILASMLVLNTSAKSKQKYLWERVGVCADLSDASIIAKGGGHHVEINLNEMLMPEKSDADFAANKLAISQCAVPVLSTNCFFPGGIHLTGPEADIEKALRYTEVALRRASEVGIRLTVLGSSGARNIPEGFSPEKAREQFIEFLKRAAPIAKKYHIVIAVEPLRRAESNFINTVKEGYEIAKEVGHPNVKVNADIFHMMQEGESPQSIIDAGKKYIAHVHIAENARRTPPGTDGDDFTPYFKALKQIGYKGNISIECGWEDMDSQVAPAISEVKRQLKLAFF